MAKQTETKSTQSEGKTNNKSSGDSKYDGFEKDGSFYIREKGSYFYRLTDKKEMTIEKVVRPSMNSTTIYQGKSMSASEFKKFVEEQGI